MFKALVRPKPCRIIMALRDAEIPWHLSRLAKATDTTYVYVTGFVSRLQKEGFVSVEPKGKKRIVRLTEKGTKVANAIEELENSLEA